MNRAAIATSALAAAGARLAYGALRRRPPGGSGRWTRTNHRGETVTLAEGPAAAAAAVGAVLCCPGLGGGQKAALAVAGAGAAAFGCYDDLAGSGDRRGFRGHLGALASGELTSGAVKVGGIGVTGVAASALLAAAPAAGPRSAGAHGGGAPGVAAAADLLINAGLIAGAANLINLFDLRPGRAIKVVLATGLPLAAAPEPAGLAVAAPLGAAVAMLPDDLGERAMLGDAGANALGAMLGAAAAAALPRPARLAVLVAVAGLTAASEVVSFTKVIERTPALRALDMLGRRPAAEAAPSADRAAAASAGATAAAAGVRPPPAAPAAAARR
jgi:UDP-GlcNAc:undecaprenyl-phosphate GlcNAc-1-phosphate transferase